MDYPKVLKIQHRLEAKNPDFENIRIYDDYRYQVNKGGQRE